MVLGIPLGSNLVQQWLKHTIENQSCVINGQTRVDFSWIGIWIVKQELESSNFKEFGNLVDSIEAEGASGRLKNSASSLCSLIV